MTYEFIYAHDPPMVIMEDDGDELFHVYVEGELVGLGHNFEAALEIAEEVFDAIHGDPLEEGDYL